MIPTYLPAALTVIGSLSKTLGILGQGAAGVKAAERRKQAAEFEAAQLDQNAGQAKAAAQRVAYQKGVEGDLMLSRLKALAAASGGGATDPTVLNLQAGLMHQKAYNLAAALYRGEDDARTMRMQAAAKRYQADLGVADAEDARTASYFAAAGTAASGGASFYEKYGKDLWPGNEWGTGSKYGNQDIGNFL